MMIKTNVNIITISKEDKYIFSTWFHMMTVWTVTKFFVIFARWNMLNIIFHCLLKFATFYTSSTEDKVDTLEILLWK